MRDMAPAFDTTSPHTQALGVAVSGLLETQARLCALQAEQVRHLADISRLAAAETDRVAAHTPTSAAVGLAFRAARAEIAAATHQSEHTIDREMADAVTLTQHYADTLSAFAGGQLSLEHCRVIMHAGRVIGNDTGDTNDAVSEAETAARRFAYEQAVLPFAVAETPHRLRPIAQRLAEQYAERSFDERHEQACLRRRVYVVEQGDGMSDLVAHLPSTEAHSIRERLTRMVHELEQTERATDAPTRRSRDQRRADLLSDLLRTSEPSTAPVVGGVSGSGGVNRLGSTPESDGAPESGSTPGSGISAGVTARIQVVITDEALFAERLRDTSGTHTRGTHAPGTRAPGAHGPGITTSHVPAELVGAGLIDTATAQHLAGEAPQWELIHHHPVTGQVLRVERYRPNAELRRYLAARDLHCRFPGCRAPVARCDIDHTVAASDGGETSSTNLGLLCRGHHLVKHHTGWRVAQSRDGTFTWSSPAGRQYRERPPSAVRFETIHSPARHHQPRHSRPSDSRPSEPAPY